MYDDCTVLSMRFPQKLWKIVNECDTGAVCWSTSGTSVLLDYKKFQAEFLNCENPIFKTKNITSFIRQLNLYGFRKVTLHNRDPNSRFQKSDVHEFLHEHFRAGRIELLAKVCRNTGANKRYKPPVTRLAMSDSPGKSHLVKRDDGELPTPYTRLQMCQMALTKALDEIASNYRREKYLKERKVNGTLYDCCKEEEKGGEVSSSQNIITMQWIYER